MRTSNERFWIGAAWGLAATFIMCLAMVFLWIVGLGEPIPLTLAARFVARILHMTTLTVGVVVLASVGFFAYGALWSGLLAASTRRVTWWKGLVVGFGLWVIMMVFYLPIGGDVFRLATSRAVWMSSLLGHLIYGVSVGLLAGRHQPELIEEPV